MAPTTRTTGAAVRRSDTDAGDRVSHRLLTIELHRDDRSLPSRIAAPAPGDLVAQVTFGPRRRSVDSTRLVLPGPPLSGTNEVKALEPSTMPTGHGNDRGEVKVRSKRHNGPDVAKHVQHLEPDVWPRWGGPGDRRQSGRGFSVNRTRLSVPTREQYRDRFAAKLKTRDADGADFMLEGGTRPRHRARRNDPGHPRQLSLHSGQAILRGLRILARFQRFPRARGDAPWPGMKFDKATMVPPRARGCTQPVVVVNLVFRGSPARGDAPSTLTGRVARSSVPPRTRGCTPTTPALRMRCSGSPARAGRTRCRPLLVSTDRS